LKKLLLLLAFAAAQPLPAGAADVVYVENANGD
jgi:hypothetical protein